MKQHQLVISLLILLFVISMPIRSIAQEEVDVIDVIHLKNGAVLKGRILESKQQENEYKIQLQDGEVYSIEKINVKKIEQEEISPKETLLVQAVLPRWFTLFEAGLAFGLGDLNQQGYTLDNEGIYPNMHIVNTFMLGRSTSMGIGIGYQNYEYGDMMPVFLDFRVYVGRKEIMPMAVINAGYGFGWPRDKNDPEWAGVFINPAIGAAYKLPAGSVLFLRLGYKLHRIGYEINHDLNQLNTPYFCLRFGVKF